MAMRVKSYESSQRSKPLPNVDTGPLANDSAAFGGNDKTGASIQRFAEAAQGLNESVFDVGLRAQKKAKEDELALKLIEAQQRDKSLWDEQWESIKQSAPSVVDTSNPPAAPWRPAGTAGQGAGLFAAPTDPRRQSGPPGGSHRPQKPGQRRYLERQPRGDGAGRRA